MSSAETNKPEETSHQQALRIWSELGAPDFGKVNASDAAQCAKAGVIVYKRDAMGELKFRLMLPKPKAAMLTAPDFQITKGGRTVIGLNGEHIDVREVGDLKTGNPLDPAVDAIREGIEEQGLRVDNIKQIRTIGLQHFTSQTKGSYEPLWVVAAEVNDEEAFDIPTESKTAKCDWFSLNDLKAAKKNALEGAASVMVGDRKVRTDHIQILENFTKLIEPTKRINIVDNAVLGVFL